MRALTIVTLAGGLASTVFAPLTAALAEHLSWRHTYLVLASILAAVAIPAHALALRAPWPDAPTAAAHRGAGVAAVGRSRPFLLLAAAFTLSAFAMYAVVVALVPLLLERGYTTSHAAWALGIGGAGQTLGRTLYAALVRRTTATTRTTMIIALGALTTAAFAAVPGPYAPDRHRVDRGRHGPRQPHPAPGRRHHRPLGRHPLRPPLRPSRGTGHYCGSPRAVRRRCPGRAARRLRATVLPSGHRLRSRRAHRTVDRNHRRTAPLAP